MARACKRALHETACLAINLACPNNLFTEPFLSNAPPALRMSLASENLNPVIPSQLLGVNLGSHMGSLRSDLFAAWRGMLGWPVISWLWPESDIRLWLPNAGLGVSRGLSSDMVLDKSRAQSASFEALLLPETLLLRKHVTLPQLQANEMAAALALEVQTISPFAFEDTVWAYQTDAASGVSAQIHLAVTSRKLIAQHAESMFPRLDLKTAEVWAQQVGGKGFTALPGFGDTRRQRHNHIWRWVSALLVFGVLALAAAIALTPTLRLYLMSLQAGQALEIVAKNASPAVQQREALLRLNEQISGLDKLVDRPVPPLQTLSLITQALPDDTSLLSLQLQGLKVTMTGQTANAASLMKQLGGTAGLQEVKAPTAATKPLGATREQFTIEFMLDPAQLKAGL